MPHAPTRSGPKAETASNCIRALPKYSAQYTQFDEKARNPLRPQPESTKVDFALCSREFTRRET